MPPMPPIYQPPRQGGGVARFIAGFAILALGLSLVFNFVLLMVVGMSGPDRRGGIVREVVIPGPRSDTIALIPVQGMILDDTEQQFRNALLAAEQDGVRALLVHINSPGGTTADSDQMYAALQDFKSRTGIPVVVHMDTVAASGGYYVACAADAIFAEHTTITGSIGVMLQYPQLDRFAEKTGLRLRTIVADESPQKNLLDAFEEPTEEQMERVRRLLNGQYERFRDVVAQSRGAALASAGVSIEDVADGSVFLGPEALEVGLIDGLGFLDDAISDAASRAGLPDYRVVQYSAPPTLFQALGLARHAGALTGRAGPDGPRIEDLGDNLGEAATRLIHELSAPRVMYLYRGLQ